MASIAGRVDRPAAIWALFDARQGTRNQCPGRRRTRSIASSSVVGQTQRFSPSGVVEFFPGNEAVMDPPLSAQYDAMLGKEWGIGITGGLSTDCVLVNANNKNRQTDDGFTPTNNNHWPSSSSLEITSR